MNFYQKILCSIVFFTFVTILYSQTKDDPLMQNFRLECACKDNINDSLLLIQNRLNNLQNDTSLSYDDKLLCENILVWEQYSYQTALQDDNRCKPILAQYDKVLQRLKDKDINSIDVFLLLSCADIMSCAMNFVSKAQILIQGPNVKKYYENIVQRKEDFPFALCNLGQWYYYAPTIGGGNKKLGLQYCKTACDKAKTDYERMYTYTTFSQCCFAIGDKTQASLYLEMAKQVSPKAFRVIACMALNAFDSSWFDYARNPQKYTTIIK